MGKDFVEDCNKAREKYHPIEINPSLSPEEKDKFMVEWWKDTQNLLLAAKLTKNLIRVLSF